MQRETQAFIRMHADLLGKYPGDYVAIYQGKLIDHDHDQLALYQRVRKATAEHTGSHQAGTGRS